MTKRIIFFLAFALGFFWSQANADVGQNPTSYEIDG